MTWTTPKTWNVGDLMTSTDLNTYVRDNSNITFGDANWTVPTLTNGWTAAGGTAFALVGRLVVMHGAIIPGTANTAAFTLPLGYRPAVQGNWPVAGPTTVTTVNMINIAPTGAVTPSNATNCWLNSIAFPTF